MDTCVRGFSFMSEIKTEVTDLKFIEGGELERTWKATRRQKLKEQEQKIWSEFVKEQDAVKALCKDDPYQFIEQLSEPLLREYLERELLKSQNEKSDVEKNEQPLGEGDAANVLQEEETQNAVTVVEQEKEEINDMFHIFDDEFSGPEAENLNESICSPCTVQEISNEDIKEDQCEHLSNPVTDVNTVDKELNSKSSENVTSVIESSVYCAKVKDLRAKIDEQINAILVWLERREILTLEADEVLRMSKRSAEFSNRFNRIYMYQLQRQMYDIKRHSDKALPYAKHTQFQSQMIRIASLHQNVYQAYQVFYKSLDQTSCIRECAECLHTLIQATRDTSEVCSSVPAPKDFSTAVNLYNDPVLAICDKLDEVLKEYTVTVTDFLNTTCNNSTSTSHKSKSLSKNKSSGKLRKINPKSITDTRLSMYSLDTARGINAKYSSSKEFQSSGTSRAREHMENVSGVQKKEAEKTDPAKGLKKSPRCRRPLMRDPHAGKPRAPRPVRDTDIRTMVEAVDNCTSSHISRETSPHAVKEVTPRNNRPTNNMPRKSQTSTPRTRKQSPPKTKCHKPPQPTKSALSSHRSEVNDMECSQISLAPLSRVQCAKKDSPRIVELEKGVEVKSPKPSLRSKEVAAEAGRIEKINNREKSVTQAMSPGICETTQLLRHLCGTDASCAKIESLTGARNAKLLCLSDSTSPKQPTTPQLLKILEETIRKKSPRHLYQQPTASKAPSNDMDRLRMTFNIPERTAKNIFQYRTKFVQHMLASPMYANSAVGKPWEMVGSVSEQIIDELLVTCAKELQLGNVIEDLYNSEIK